MLMLNTPETSRPKRFMYDPDVPGDVEAVQAQAAALRERGFKFSAHESSWGEMVFYPPEKDPHHGCMRIMCDDGDKRVVWDRRSPDEVREAFAKFKELIDSDHRAYVSRSDGSRGSKLDAFDPLLEEILMVPPTMPG
jgi:hypothetical protein